MSNETKQTAVEWMFNEITLEFTLKGSLSFMDLVNITQKAKEIQHDQMMQCYSDGLGNGIAVGQGECSYQSVADEKEYLIKKYGGNK